MMTDEQIKQNAKAYAIENYGEYDEHDYTDHSGSNMCHAVSEKAFIAGAHSRDEEIKQIKNEASAIMDEACALKVQLDQLRNPWISVEERLPPIKIRVLFLDKNGKVWLGRNTIAMQAELETDENNNLLPPPTVPPAKPVITHWMPIPSLKGGEK